MVAGLIARNYEMLRIKADKAKMNFYKWFFHRRKEHTATTLHVCHTCEDEDDKERYKNNNNKNRKERAAEYEDGDKPFFEDVIGYNDIKKLIRMSINAYEPVHILLSGPPASSKTLFMKCLMMKLQNSYFTDGGNSTKAGMLDYIFEKKPKYLLIDEIDKMSAKDQTFLLNLMETGIISETKYEKTRAEEVKTWVFATSNNISNIIPALKSRFFVIELEPYTYEQFYEITVRLLTNQHKVKEEIARATADAVWNRIKSADIRDCVRVARMAKSIEDVNFIVDSFLKYKVSINRKKTQIK
jgi:replication-associated recombination protein RarA